MYTTIYTNIQISQQFKFKFKFKLSAKLNLNLNCPPNLKSREKYKAKFISRDFARFQILIWLDGGQNLNLNCCDILICSISISMHVYLVHLVYDTIPQNYIYGINITY